MGTRYIDILYSISNILYLVFFKNHNFWPVLPLYWMDSVYFSHYDFSSPIVSVSFLIQCQNSIVVEKIYPILYILMRKLIIQLHVRKELQETEEKRLVCFVLVVIVVLVVATRGEVGAVGFEKSTQARLQGSQSIFKGLKGNILF